MKKLLFALLVAVVGLAFSGCDKETEAAAVLNVVVMDKASQPLVDYPVVITKTMDRPLVVSKEGVTNKEGKCTFLFDAAELSSIDPVNKGNYTEAYIVILNPQTKEAMTNTQFLIKQGQTLERSAWLEVK